jgi:hypothetical protein
MEQLHQKWRVPFAKWPSWTCPTCQNGDLKAVDASLRKVETGPSKQAHAHEAWDPDWVTKRYILLFERTNQECGEVVTCSGDVSVEEDNFYGADGELKRKWLDRFTPKYFHPPLLFFRIEAECPEEVAQHLTRAFALAWSDTASAVNAMRTALEAILSERGVARTVVNAKRKRVPIPLHHRLRATQKRIGMLQNTSKL